MLPRLPSLLPRLASRTLTTSTSMTPSSVPFLLTPSALSTLLSSPKPPIVLDSTWFMPNLSPPRDAWKEFKERRIEGSRFWSLEGVAGEGEGEVEGLKHMLPEKERFRECCCIERNDHVVFYDTTSVFSSPRAAWTFKSFGHRNISILDGGLPRWLAEKHPIDISPPTVPNPHSTEYKPNTFGPILSVLLYDSRPGIESYFIGDVEELGEREYLFEEGWEGDGKEGVRTYGDVVKNSEKGEEGDIVLDARPAGRYHGTTPEPRPSLSSGHIPNSLSLPFSTLLTSPTSTSPPYQTYLPLPSLSQVFLKALGEQNFELVKQGKRDVVMTCGSGMTAAVLWWGLMLVREGESRGVGLYDESWTGYAGREGSKIVKTVE